MVAILALAFLGDMTQIEPNMNYWETQAEFSTLEVVQKLIKLNKAVFTLAK
jgi:hypothetical protein